MDDVTLNFQDNEYHVPAEKTWGLIEVIEDVVSFTELAPRMQAQKPPIMKIMRAYAEALKYAGAREVTPEAVKDGIDIRDTLRMGYELVAIMSLGFPSKDLDLGEAGEAKTKQAKKKPTTKSPKTASKPG